MTDHREQNSSFPRHRQEIPRGFLTEWEATSMKPTEDAKMGNGEAERLVHGREAAYRAYINEMTPNGNSRITNAMLCAGPDERQQRHIATQMDMAFQEGWHAALRTQAARIAELEAHIARWSSIEGEVTRKAHARAEAAEAALSEMTRRRDEWRKKAEGFEAVRLALREKVGTPWPPHMSRLMWAGIAADEKKRADDAEADVARIREAQTQAATDVLAERQRQISAEGWTPGHDDAHMFGEMATAASSYAAAAGVEAPLRDLIERGKSFPENWPWSKDWWKPTTRRRDLVKAGALILAEIERLDRAALQPKQED